LLNNDFSAGQNPGTEEDLKVRGKGVEGSSHYTPAFARMGACKVKKRVI